MRSFAQKLAVKNCRILRKNTMQKRVSKLVRVSPPEGVDCLLRSHGDTVPTNATAGYETGCIFHHLDGSAESSLYVNEGSTTSCLFVPLLTSSSEAADLPDIGTLAYGSGAILVADGDSYEEVAVSGQATLASTGALTIPLLGATAGTNTASKALIVDSAKGLDRLFVDTAPVSSVLPSLSVGVPGTKVVDTVEGDDSIAFYAGMSTGVNKTAENTSCLAAYVQVANTAAGTNTRLQGVLSGCSVGYNCFDAYAVQGHTTVEASGMSTKNANAHITGLSGKANLLGDVGQGWVTGVLAIMEGPGTVTGLCHVIAAQVEATCTDSVVDAILYLGADALATNAIEVADVAHVTNLLKLNAASGCIIANELVPEAEPSNLTVGAAKALRIVIGTDVYYIPLYDTLKV